MSESRAPTARRLDDIRPSTWLLANHRAGDNNQVLALAEMLGWPFEIKTLVHRSNRLLSKLISKQVMGVTLAGIDCRRSSQLEPPWPDVVISSGRDNEPVARWIRNRSGGHTRLVHLGRPWAPLHAFDLIVTTPQYFLPERHNIVQIDLPLHRVTPARIAEARIQWQERFAHLQPPFTAVMVGGNSGHLVLTRNKARRLGRLVNELAVVSGGSVLVTSSARTPRPAFEVLCAQISAPAYIYNWTAARDNNPYFGYLALADQIVVTSESVSMLAEASATGKPVFLFDLAEDGDDDNSSCWLRWRKRWSYRMLRHRLAVRFGPRRMHRDISRIQRHLVANGRASWLGRAGNGEIHVINPGDVHHDAMQAVVRVRELFHG